MGFVRDEIYMVTARRVFDCLDRVSFEQGAIICVLRFLKISRPGGIVGTIGDRFGFAVVMIVGVRCHPCL